MNPFALLKRLSGRFTQGNKNLLSLKFGREIKPRWIWFGVTERCNSRCRHCQIWKKHPAGRELTLAEIRKIFSDPLFSKVEAVINSGGEILLRPDILEIVKLERELFPGAEYFNLSTNGLLPERALEVAENLLKDGVKLNVSVSLDGLNGEHDRIRGVEGNFVKADRLIKGLVKLREKYPARLSLVIGLTLSDLTADNWRPVKDYARSQGIEFMMQWYNQSSFYDNEAKDENSGKGRLKQAVAAQPKTMVNEKWLRWLDGRPIKFDCLAARSFFVLRCDGKIAPCLTHWDEVMGNALEETPSQIWRSAAAEKARRKVAACPGCLNSWGVEWSASALFYPRLKFYLTNPGVIIDRLRRGN